MNIQEMKPYGLKYNHNLRLKEITIEIRKELRSLVKLGFKFSVITKDYTSIYIRIKETPSSFDLLNPHYDQQISWEFSVGKRTSFFDGKDPREQYTKEGKRLGEYLRSIGNQWNKQDEIHCIRNYYLFVVIGGTILA